MMQTPLIVTLLLVPCKVSKESWWDARQSGGIIVEQATHFVDMMRYLGGEIERDSIQAAVVGQDYPLSEMCNPGGELGVGTGSKVQDPGDTEGLSQYGRMSCLPGPASRNHSPWSTPCRVDSGNQAKAWFLYAHQRTHYTHYQALRQA